MRGHKPPTDPADGQPRRRVRLDPAVRREQVVAEATRLIARSGFNVVSLADVANACNVRKSTVLHYFPSMKALLIAVLAGRDARDFEKRPSSDDVPGQAHDLRALVTAKFADNLHQREIIRLFHLLAAEALAPEHPAHDYFRERSQRAKTELARILGWKPDPVTAALELLAFWQGLELEWLTDPQADVLPAWHSFADHFFDRTVAIDR